jgi:threonine dehydrogenase-like Zn-dependent dehydrogenase
MKASIITGPGEDKTVESPTPTVGSKDILVKIRACGLCGSDNLYISIGGLPPHDGTMPLGHEAAGEIVEVGRDVSGLAVGDHVVINPMARPEDIIGNGGTTGALADYLLIRKRRSRSERRSPAGKRPYRGGRPQRTDGGRSSRDQSGGTQAH